LIKGALLEDLKEHCNQWHDPQREDFSRAIKKVMSETISFYAVRVYGSTSENEEVLRPDRIFAFDCVDGKYNPNTPTNPSQ
jgi:hypothetical protein